MIARCDILLIFVSWAEWQNFRQVTVWLNRSMISRRRKSVTRAVDKGCQSQSNLLLYDWPRFHTSRSFRMICDIMSQQPATTWRRDSGFRQKWQSDKVVSTHLERFFLVGRVLLMYRSVELKIFFGKLDWTEDQIECSFGKDFDITAEKKDPYQTKWDCSLSSWDDRKALSSSFVSLYRSNCRLVWILFDFQRCLISSFGEHLRALRATVWHWLNLLDGG